MKEENIKRIASTIEDCVVAYLELLPIDEYLDILEKVRELTGDNIKYGQISDFDSVLKDCKPSIILELNTPSDEDKYFTFENGDYLEWFSDRSAIEDVYVIASNILFFGNSFEHKELQELIDLDKVLDRR